MFGMVLLFLLLCTLESYSTLWTCSMQFGVLSPLNRVEVSFNTNA